MASRPPSATAKLAISVLNDLKTSISDVVEQHKDDTIVMHETSSVSRVCFIVEKILHIGLQDIGFFTTTVVWDYLIELKKCLPGGDSIIDQIKSSQKTDLGRLRAFIRLGLNEQSLSSFLEALVWNKQITEKFYSKDSVLNNEEYASMMFLLLENLKQIRFKLPMVDPILGHLHYWDLKAKNAPGIETPPRIHSTTTPRESITRYTNIIIDPSDSNSPRPSLTRSENSSHQQLPAQDSSRITSEHLKNSNLEPSIKNQNLSDSSEVDMKPRDSITSQTSKQNLSLNSDPSSTLNTSQNKDILNTADAENLESKNTESSLSQYHQNEQMRISIGDSPEPTLEPPNPIETEEWAEISQSLGSLLSQTINTLKSEPGQWIPDTILQSTSSAPEINLENQEDRDTTFEDDFEVSTTPHEHGVLYTPPTSTRIPRGSSSLNRLSAGDLLGNTPSQSDLSAITYSLYNSDVSNHHKQLLINLQDAIQTLYSRKSGSIGISHAVDVLFAIEDIMLDSMKPTEPTGSLGLVETAYLTVYLWLASVHPAVPHAAQTLTWISQFANRAGPIGLTRGFINSALNRKCLDSFLEALVSDAIDRIPSPYLPSSILAQEQLFTVFQKLLQQLKQFNLDLECNPNELQEIDLYERSNKDLPSFSMAFIPPSNNTSSQQANNTTEKPASFKRRRKVITIQEATVVPPKQTSNLPEANALSSAPTPTINTQERKSPFSAAISNLMTAPKFSSSFSSAVTFEHQPTQAPGSAKIRAFGSSSLGDSSLYANQSRATSLKLSYTPSPSESFGPKNQSPAVLAGDNRTNKSWFANSTRRPTHLSSDEDESLPAASPSPPVSYGRHFDQSTNQAYPPAPSSINSSNEDKDDSHTRDLITRQTPPHSGRKRSFSSNAPKWALEIRRSVEPGTSYQPNTSWLGNWNDDSEDDSVLGSPPARSTIIEIPTSSSPASSSSVIFANSPILPRKMLTAEIINEYSPAERNSVLKRSGYKGSLADNDENVVKIRPPDGEEALESESQLYKNSKPADFFVLELLTKPPLTSKNSVCGQCGEDLAPSGARWCAYSGNYYCTQCHSNSSMIIPARVLQKWDFRPAKVSNWARDYLQANWARPVLDVSSLIIKANKPKSFFSKGSSVSVIFQLNIKRERLVTVAEFIRTCRHGKRLLANLGERFHLLWSSTLWSMQDLVDAKEGRLDPILTVSLEKYSTHVHHCDTCSGKGFICEFCNNPEVIYPFDEKITSCPDCKTLFHQVCWKSNPNRCPKCIRARLIKSKSQSGENGTPRDERAEAPTAGVFRSD